MSSRELIFAALGNKAVERTPVGFWYHFTENPGADVFTHKEMWDQNLNGHRKFFKEFKPDVVKIMSDGFFVYPHPLLGTAKSARELAAGLQPVGANHPWVEKQVELVKTLTAGFAGTPAFYNLFAPATLFRIARTAAGQNGDTVLADFLAEDAAALAAALAVVASDLELVAKRVIQEGKADGIYLSAKDIQDSRVTGEVHGESIAPSETSILRAAKAAGGTNLLHVCGYRGNRNTLSHFTSYPADAVNWAVTVEGVSLAEGKKLFGGKPVIGGFDNTDQGVLYKGTKAEVEAETRRIIGESGRVGVIVGADCTIPADIATERLNWVRDAAR
jgi:uroporphyrinogen decarboxylase